MTTKTEDKKESQRRANGETPSTGRPTEDKKESRRLSMVSEDSPSRVMVLSVESVVRDGTAVFKLLASEDVNGGIASVRTTDDGDGG